MVYNSEDNGLSASTPPPLSFHGSETTRSVGINLDRRPLPLGRDTNLTATSTHGELVGQSLLSLQSYSNTSLSVKRPPNRVELTTCSLSSQSKRPLYPAELYITRLSPFKPGEATSFLKQAFLSVTFICLFSTSSSKSCGLSHYSVNGSNRVK
ncbi:hypothetical protein RRG08_063345 [Elysia crispata]|uniref:Uncharacterized protein n=1 Tax=Elysia crispata TaxID=231223 RepID=A0AAE1E9D5_9GAST|nr:hypothetical protein RRG08_063345 [Elysia crispata]